MIQSSYTSSGTHSTVTAAFNFPLPRHTLQETLTLSPHSSSPQCHPFPQHVAHLNPRNSSRSVLCSSAKSGADNNSACCFLLMFYNSSFSKSRSSCARFSSKYPLPNLLIVAHPYQTFICTRYSTTCHCHCPGGYTQNPHPTLLILYFLILILIFVII